MGNKEKILNFLQSIAPESASNGDIVSRVGIKSHQHVFQITRALVSEGFIKSYQDGKEWHFRHSSIPDPKNPAVIETGNILEKPSAQALDHAVFEHNAKISMSKKFGADLVALTVPGVRKKFDLVSEDFSIVGDAKFYSAVKGTGIPPAKFATIAEYVWLLEKTNAEHKFLVFGNDRRVPEWWLERYGNLLNGVDFYFLDKDSILHLLNKI